MTALLNAPCTVGGTLGRQAACASREPLRRFARVRWMNISDTTFSRGLYTQRKKNFNPIHSNTTAPGRARAAAAHAPRRPRPALHPYSFLVFSVHCTLYRPGDRRGLESTVLTPDGALTAHSAPACPAS